MSDTLDTREMDSNSPPIVVIGGGIAGVSCVQVLAHECPNKAILLISASAIVKVVDNVKRMGASIEQFDVRQQHNSYLRDQYPNVNVIISSVIALNARHRELTLECGKRINYEKVCVCSGAKPNLIDYQLDEQKRQLIMGIRDVQTVDTFQERLTSAKRIVIVGNGGIATEMVYEIQDCHVVWAVKDSSFGATFFDCGAANFFADSLHSSRNACEPTLSKRVKYTVSSSESTKTQFGIALGPDWALGRSLTGSDAKRVDIEYNCEVKRIYSQLQDIPVSIKHLMDENDFGIIWPLYVELTNGKLFGCDFVLSATGVIPNSQPFLTGNHFETDTDGAIIVNNEMMTSEEHVYAAGDVCAVGWKPSEHWFQMRLWTQARLMGVYAAYCIASRFNNSSPLVYFNFEIFTHVTRFFGYKVVLLGLFNGQKLDNNYEILVRYTAGVEYVKVILKDDKMCGAVLIGETDLEETFENLILNQLDLSPYGDDLLNSTIDIDDYFD